MKRLELRPGFVALLCFFYYISPRWVFVPFLLLCFVHELGHLAALSVLGVRLRRVRLGAFGAVMETEEMSFGAETVCALAGPGVNLFCFWALRRVWPAAALISLLLGCYNLIPVYPLDGGRALRAFFSLCLPPTAAYRAEYAVSGAFVLSCGLMCLCCAGAFGAAPWCLLVLLLAHVCLERNSCCDFARQPI